MVTTRLVQSEPALVLEDKRRYLVITDIHIGFESRLVTNHIHVNPKDTISEITQELQKIIDAQKPDVLVLLGDVKSSVKSISKVEWSAVPLFFEIGKQIETLVVPGNHDGNIQKLAPDWVTVSSSTGIVIDDVLLTHGHVMPSENFSHVNKIIMGHVHPVYFSEGSVLDGQRVWVSLKSDKSKVFPSSHGELEVTIIPSFNKYFYATYRKTHKRSISPILEAVREPHSAKIATLDGSIIGNESMLSTVL